MDFLPTCAAISGAKMPDNRVIDGKNLLPLMEGRKGPRVRTRPFFTVRTVRSGKWKLKGQGIVRSGRKETQNLATNPEVVRLGGYLAKQDLAKNKRRQGLRNSKQRKNKREENALLSFLGMGLVLSKRLYFVYWYLEIYLNSTWHVCNLYLKFFLLATLLSLVRTLLLLRRRLNLSLSSGSSFKVQGSQGRLVGWGSFRSPTSNWLQRIFSN